MRLKSNIDKIKILTDALIDRDYVRSKIVELFDKFCNDFPIQMNAWIVEEDLTITSRMGDSILKIDKNKDNLNNILSGTSREKNIEMHKKAFLGESSVYTIESDGKVLLTKVMPANNSKDLVFGFSMDITSFVKSSAALQLHCKDVENIDCELVKQVREDNLYKLVKGAQKNG